MSNNTHTTNRKLLRLSATLLLAGILITFLAGMSHPDSAPANDDFASFTEYSQDADWVAVHLGQFAGMAVLIAGLLMLGLAIDTYSETVGKLGAVSAVIALGLYSVLQAVDGVALKQVVDGWVSAPEAEKSARFASAEAIRWLEWAIRSYQSFLLGVTFILYAFVIVRRERIPRMSVCQTLRRPVRSVEMKGLMMKTKHYLAGLLISLPSQMERERTRVITRAVD